jgi:uncharacterized protein (DUF2062 family)
MWTLAGVITGMGIIALTMWAISEWDERRWRQRMSEIASEGFDRG